MGALQQNILWEEEIKNNDYISCGSISKGKIYIVN